ncbi:MAG: hypothetical protein KDB58_13365 [Solirubrobacterales bacterium]|nr:hypothetical protein [Solirubrobacterales bacterium]MCB8971746.1 hypothetical protein [Thermoleophilales bacterium]MCO5327968.1 hypothetical protein [Solirubrobacterales bacterium]
MRLLYSASVDSGVANYVAQVFRKGRAVATLNQDYRDSTGGTYTFTWRAPKRYKGKLSFCVSGVDAAGNGSPASCAALKLKKAKKRKR